MNNAVHYEDALMVKAAWYYYFENMTQQAIADRLSISRMRVIKLLETARQSGVIQFRLRSDSVGMMQQSRELMQKYHLNDVFIIPEAEQEGQLTESIPRAGAMYVADRLGENACINVGYGDTLSRTLNHLATMVQTPVTCISLTGGVSYYLPNGRSNIFNARLYLMPAPLLASSHEMAAAMRAEASVSEIIRMAALSSFTLVGIGAMHETATIVRSGIITQNELFRLKMSGAVGDVLCHFVDENGEYVGFDIDLAKEVTSRLGVELVLQPIAWDSKELELSGKNIDCIWSGLTMTPERIEQMTFSIPYLANEQILVVRSDSGIASEADLSGKVLGTQAGSSSVDVLNANPDLMAAIGEPQLYDDFVTALMDLKLGGIDVLLIDSVVGNYYIAQQDDPTQFTVLPEVLEAEEYGIAFRKGEQTLADAVSQQLIDMFKDGTLDTIRAKWFANDITLVAQYAN